MNVGSGVKPLVSSSVASEGSNKKKNAAPQDDEGGRYQAARSPHSL